MYLFVALVTDLPCLCQSHSICSLYYHSWLYCFLKFIGYLFVDCMLSRVAIFSLGGEMQKGGGFYQSLPYTKIISSLAQGQGWRFWRNYWLSLLPYDSCHIFFCSLTLGICLSICPKELRTSNSPRLKAWSGEHKNLKNMHFQLSKWIAILASNGIDIWPKLFL